MIYNNNEPPSTPGVKIVTHTGPTYDGGAPLFYRGTGNQVVLSGGTPQKWMPVLTNFTCSYWSTETVTPSSPADPKGGRLTFYANDGLPYGPSGPLKPATVLWQSGWFEVASTSNSITHQIDLGTVIADSTYDWAGGLTLPSEEFTWALEFAGLTAKNSGGLFMNQASQASVGYNRYPYAFWQENSLGDDWDARENINGQYAGFSVSFQGTEWVPEPSPVLYGAVLCGGVGFWMVRRRMQRPAAAK